MVRQKYFYKVLTEDLRAPNNLDYKYDITKEAVHEDKLIMCYKGLHLCKSLNKLNIGNFGSRVFKVIHTGNKIIEDKDKVVVDKFKFVKELKPEDVNCNKWIYYY